MNFNNLLNRVKKKTDSKRFIEIDILRGLALILMIFGHILWDLDYFGLTTMNNNIYSFLQQIVPPLFFLIVGISLIVSKKKIEKITLKQEKKYYIHLLIRGFKILILGLILTIFSLIFIPSKPVFFGVLHCIGLTIILSIPFLKYRNYNLSFAIILLFIGSIINQNHVANPTIFQLILGFHQVDIWRYTVDYFPILPWFGVSLLGIVIGDWLYCGDKRKFKLPNIEKYRPIKVFQWAGQHSLLIYLIHQPLIAGFLSIFLIL